MTVEQGTAEGSSNMCMLAKRVPRVVKTGDPQQDKELEVQRSSLIGVINMLHREPALCMPTFLALTEGKIVVTQADRSEWSDLYNCVQRFPKYFKAQILAADSLNGLSQDDMNRINSKNPDSIGMLFNIATQMRDSTAVPREILNKGWSAKVFLRMTQLGHRIRHLKGQNALSADGAIDWTKFGCYIAEWDAAGQKVTAMRHISGDRAEMPQNMNVGRDFKIVNHADEMETQFMHDGVYVTCPARFEADKGPHKHDLGKSKARHLDKFKELSRQLAEMPGNAQPPAVVPDAKYLARSETEAKEQKRVRAKARIEAEGPARKRSKTVAIVATTT